MSESNYTTNSKEYKEIFKRKEENFLRRQSLMNVKVFELKIDTRSCNQTQKDFLKNVFVEGKWFYNACIAFGKENTENKPWKYDYKKKSVVHFDKDKNPIESEFKLFSSQSRQNVLKRIATSCKSIKTNLKRNNIKHTQGLRFKSEFNSVPFTQFEVSWKFEGIKIKLAKCSKPFKVYGLEQLRIDGIEFANLTLIQRSTGYYLLVTAYVPKQEKEHNYKTIGLDFGCETSFTYYIEETEESGKLNYIFEQTEKEKRLRRKISRRRVRNFSNRSNKGLRLRNQLRKESEKRLNKKKEETNQLCHWLSGFETIIFQNELISLWQKSNHGKKINNGILGRVKTKLKNLPNSFVLDSSLPTSKFCFDCFSKNENLKLSDRTFICPVCGSVMDRDIHASKNMILFYHLIQMIPSERRKSEKESKKLLKFLLSNIKKRMETSSSGLTFEEIQKLVQELSLRYETCGL